MAFDGSEKFVEDLGRRRRTVSPTRITVKRKEPHLTTTVET
ncbi:MAG: hypothetical protein QOG00_1389 [Pyrinomonadaceae bacterium]|nr:hypothetical protein [Pyrinomonadaceae bacterium]